MAPGCWTHPCALHPQKSCSIGYCRKQACLIGYCRTPREPPIGWMELLGPACIRPGTLRACTPAGRQHISFRVQAPQDLAQRVGGRRQLVRQRRLFMPLHASCHSLLLVNAAVLVRLGMGIPEKPVDKAGGSTGCRVAAYGHSRGLLRRSALGPPSVPWARVRYPTLMHCRAPGSAARWGRAGRKLADARGRCDLLRGR